MVLRSDVLFALNSAALTPAAKAAVTTLATQIRSAHVTGTIQINGYTDNLGTVDKNLALSKARALAVAQVLQAGLAGQSVTLAPQGFGQANPVAPNTTDPNRARNRRVTIVLPTTHANRSEHEDGTRPQAVAHARDHGGAHGITHPSPTILATFTERDGKSGPMT